jgi:hypothetical protein
VNKKIFIEAVKEFLRYLLIGLSASIIPAVLVGINTTVGSFEINWMLVLALAVATLLGALVKAVDKFLHEWGKETENDGLTKGLTRF